jgi:hypothetical protein
MPQVVVVNKRLDAWEEQGIDEENRLKILEEQLKSEMGHTRLMWVAPRSAMARMH